MPKKKTTKKKTTKKTNQKTKTTKSKKTKDITQPEKFLEIDRELNKEDLRVKDIFEIKMFDEDDDGTIMHVGFTELGNKAVNALMKRNPKITEEDVEAYVRGISSRLIVLLAEKYLEENNVDKE